MLARANKYHAQYQQRSAIILARATKYPTQPQYQVPNTNRNQPLCQPSELKQPPTAKTRGLRPPDEDHLQVLAALNHYFSKPHFSGPLPDLGGGVFPEIFI